MSNRHNKTTGNLNRRVTSTSATPPPSAAAPNIARIRLTSPDNAKKELIERKLIPASSTITVNTLINILIGFTGKEESLDGLGEPWEIVVAVGHLLEAEVVSLVSKATADATFSRLESLREMVRKERDEEIKRLENREMETKQKEDRLKEEAGRQMEESRLLEEEKGRIAGERKLLSEERVAWLEERKKTDAEGRKLEESVGKMQELLGKLDKEASGGRPDAEDGVRGRGAGPESWERSHGGGWGNKQSGDGDARRSGFARGQRATGGFCGTRGSYAEATAMGGPGGGYGGDERDDGLGLTDQRIKDGEEQLKRDEERRARQLMLDAEVVNGQKGLTGLTPQQLIEKAFAALNELTGEGLMRFSNYQHAHMEAYRSQ